MNLCIDIGNTLLKVAIFDGKSDLIFFKKYTKLYVKELKRLQKKYGFEKSIISSTRGKKMGWYNHLKTNYHLIILDDKTKVNFSNLYKTPKTLGRDRIAAVAAAVALYPKQNNLVVDLGTCITYDFVNKRKQYLGGNIAPGWNMRLDAMHRFTHTLPRPKAKKPAGILGKSTIEALQNGAAFGVLGEIRAYKAALETKYANINVILTGGDGAFFAELIDYQIFVDPNFVLKGLNEILKSN